jgi:transposase InsO family protein
MPDAIVKALSKAIEKRFVAEPILKVMVHNDRGTKFSSQAYNNFTKHLEKFVIPSMSRENTPTDNTVAKRFMLTFEEIKEYLNKLSKSLLYYKRNLT